MPNQITPVELVYRDYVTNVYSLVNNAVAQRHDAEIRNGHDPIYFLDNAAHGGPFINLRWMDLPYFVTSE
jgi:hypothetical protein